MMQTDVGVADTADHRAVQIECTRQLSMWIQLVSNQKAGKCAERSGEVAGRSASDKFEIVTSAHGLR